MITCDTCGNDYRGHPRTCPYCGAALTSHRQTDRGGRRETVILNIKTGMPTVDQALARLEERIHNARASGQRTLKIIHGYGASGKGGSIRPAVQGRLKRYQTDGLIRTWIPGEAFGRGDERSKKVTNDFPHLKDDHDFDRQNKGITMVTL